jgi:hypothetical protein
MYPPPIQKRFLQCSSHFWNTLATSFSVRVLMTPSYFVLNLSRDKVRPAIYFFGVGERKKLAGVRSEE